MVVAVCLRPRERGKSRFHVGGQIDRSALLSVWEDEAVRGPDLSGDSRVSGNGRPSREACVPCFVISAGKL
jgi:hypothetical protein